MKYMGSKARLTKYILPIIETYRKNDPIVDLFCGGGNFIDKVTGERIANDIDKDVISALLLIRDNIDLLPKDNKEFTEDDYKRVKTDKNNILHGYVAFALSYGGKKWGGWCRGGDRDYVAEAYRNAVKQSKLLKGINFLTQSYNEVKLPEKCIIYCDPPYNNTTKYKIKFNHSKFWDWVRSNSHKHKIFVSEYTAPDDFICLWGKEVSASLTKNTGSKKATEKLFILKGIL